MMPGKQHVLCKYHKSESSYISLDILFVTVTSGTTELIIRFINILKSVILLVNR